MFEVYKRKFTEQPFPRQFVGAFETIYQAMDKFKLTPEETIEALTTVSESGYQIDQTMQFLGDGFTHQEIADYLHKSKDATERQFERAIKKLKKSGTLKPLLSKINMLRSRIYPEMKYTVTTKEEKISVDL